MTAFCVTRTWSWQTYSFVDVICVTPESGESNGFLRLYGCDSEAVLDVQLDAQDELGTGVVPSLDPATCSAWKFRCLRVVGGDLPQVGELLTSSYRRSTTYDFCKVCLLIRDASESPVSTLEKIGIERIDSLFGTTSPQTNPASNSFRSGSVLVFNRSSTVLERYGVVTLCNDLGGNRFSASIKAVGGSDLESREVLSAEWTSKIALLPIANEEAEIEEFETIGQTVAVLEIEEAGVTTSQQRGPGRKWCQEPFFDI